MAALILGFLLFGLAEIVTMVLVANAIGWEWMLLALILSSAVGAWVVKRQGIATWQLVMDGLRVGQVPTTEVLDSFLTVVAGFLALVPGFLSDLVALALAVPPLRALVRRRTVASMERRVTARVARNGSATTVMFGVGDVGDFGAYRRPVDSFEGSFGEPYSAHRDEDVIDLDAEEVIIDGPIAELEPPGERPQ